MPTREKRRWTWATLIKGGGGVHKQMLQRKDQSDRSTEASCERFNKQWAEKSGRSRSGICCWIEVADFIWRQLGAVETLEQQDQHVWKLLRWWSVGGIERGRVGCEGQLGNHYKSSNSEKRRVIGLGMCNRDVGNIAKEESVELINQLDIGSGEKERQES